jgi:hypothetical protein
MASRFQQQSLVRKVVYLGVIIGLFSTAWLWRRYSLEPQANAMAALEQNQGEVPLHASALRLSLTGTRGVFTCVLWSTAIEKQKRQEWNELEVIVDSLTNLQPHFITPWLFQSWNLAYNVSASCDRVNDKYFYITRGIDLQARGERQNRDNPTMRYWIGFYTQHKIMQSDETNVHRSLFQLSMIPPNERDPARFLKIDAQGRRTVDVSPGSEFEQFCKEHPQLVRRLQQGLPRETRLEDKRQFKCATPEAVVQFLADNRRVPSLYVEPTTWAPPGAWQKKADKLKPAYDRFPLLPPPVQAPTADNPHPARPPLPPGADPAQWNAVPFELGDLTSEDVLRDHHDANVIGRAWYGYSQEPIPPPHPKFSGESLPVVDRIRQRMPRYMATILFRHYPARAQSFVGERLQQEGWFDNEGWVVPNWFGDREVKIGADSGQMSGTAWADAYQMWKRHGEANHLLYSPEAETNLRTRAEAFAKEFPPGSPLPTQRREDLPPDLRDKWEASVILEKYNSDLHMTNFRHHYHRARVEAEPETVTARKLFHRAEALRLTADLHEALNVYEQPDALPAWKNKVLLDPSHKEFRKDEFIQEQTYEIEQKYLELINDQLKLRLTVLQPYVPLLPKTSADVFTDWIVTKGPFDINVNDKGEEDAQGEPLISETVKKGVQSRKLPQKSQAPQGPPPPQPTPPTPERPA